MRTLKEIVADFLNTDYARRDCNDKCICDLIAEMDEHMYIDNHESEDTKCPF